MARSWLVFLFGAMWLLPAPAQTGPRNPTTSSNNTGIGSSAWTTPGNIYTSNDAYATVASKGISNYLVGTGFGFAIAAPANITGLQLEVERSTLNPFNVTLLNAWSSGLTRTLSAGSDRCLVVIVGLENGTTAVTLTGMTYGGRAMTKTTEMTVGGGASFSARIEVWTMLEAQLALASGTAILPTLGAGSQVEFCESYSSAVFQNVDQLVPISSAIGSGLMGTTDPHQLGSPLNVIPGSMAVNAVLCGNNTSPASSIGGTNTYTINSGYTEGTDIYFANPSYAATGACLQTAHKTIAAAGIEQPDCDFFGSVNRHVMIGMTLQRKREIDDQVRLVKGGAIGGSNLANSTTWGTTDAYASYGGPTQLWGLSWALTDINSPNFGAAMAVRVQNGTARVDHMRMTVYSYSTLPIELLDFMAEEDGDAVALKWITASELNNDHFIIQRSSDGMTFSDLQRVAGAGNSSTTRYYTEFDHAPLLGTSYYRLKQVDLDGAELISPMVALEREREGVIVYPNPTADRLTIHTTDLQLSEVAIFGADLKLVRRAPLLQSEDPIIHIGDLADGAYFLQFITDRGVETVKVMKSSRGL